MASVSGVLTLQAKFYLKELLSTQYLNNHYRFVHKNYTNNNILNTHMPLAFITGMTYLQWNLPERPPLVSDHLSLTSRVVPYGRFHCITFLERETFLCKQHLL